MRAAGSSVWKAAGGGAVLAGAGQDHRGRRMQPDDIAEAFQQGPVFGAADDAAASGDDRGAARSGSSSSWSRAVSMSRNAGSPSSAKISGDRFAGSLFDDVVHVDQRVTEPLLEVAADGGFAATHESDENNVLRQAGRWLHGRNLACRPERRNRKIGGRIRPQVLAQPRACPRPELFKSPMTR